MNIYQKLIKIQSELKAPKNQMNTFGKYNYRSCEDILEAVKPLLAKNNLLMFIDDEIVTENGRNYVQAKVTIINAEKPEEQIFNTAYAREADTKKGMDAMQLTGATSSYARKYALNGMFAIDDTKDSDTMKPDDNAQPEPKKTNQNITEKQVKYFYSKASDFGFTNEQCKAVMNSEYGKSSAKDLTKKDMDELIARMGKKK